MILTNKRVAIIDMGTNTFHLLIADILPNDTIKVVMNEKRAVKIGEGGISQGYLSVEAQTRALAALSNFRRLINELSVNHEVVYATSALRSARNSNDFLKAIHGKTKFSPVIIDGQKEAEFIYYGVLAGLKLSPGFNLIMDIGGGSVEFIIADQKQIHWARSYEIGAQRLKDRFHTSEPIPETDLRKLQEFLDVELKSLQEGLSLYQPKTLIGVAGTFDTLSEMYSIRENNDSSLNTDTEGRFSLDAFEPLRKELTEKDLDQRIGTPGMLEFRAGMIVVAANLIDWVLKHNAFKNIRISRYSLKEGILYSMINKKL